MAEPIEITIDQVRFNGGRRCPYRVESRRLIRDYRMPGDGLPLDRGINGVILRAFSEPVLAEDTGPLDRLRDARRPTLTSIDSQQTNNGTTHETYSV